MSAADRLRWLRVVVASAFVCGVLMSPRLWLGVGRSLPRAPVIEGLPAYISSYDYLLAVLLLVVLIFSAASSRPYRYLVLSVVITALLVILDQSRLQPWVYQYLIVLALLAILHRRQLEAKSVSSVLAASQLVVALLYFWSGLQKLNWSFSHEVIPSLVESTGIHLPSVILASLPAVAIAVAMLEIAIGLGLLIPRTRRIAVGLAVAMHVFVLTIFITTGRNSVVWPWNIALIITLMVLFSRCSESPVGYLVNGSRSSHIVNHLPGMVVIICGLLPALSLAGWWDLNLSGSLYSGRAPVAVMRIDESARTLLPAKAKETIFLSSRGELMLPFYEWSLSELNVPPIPEVRMYQQIARQLCKLSNESQGNELIIRERPNLIDGKFAVTRVPCTLLMVR